MSAIVITGTDTGVGKTLFAAALTGALGAYYWKPVQSGPDDEGGSDSERVARLAGIPAAQVLPEVYRLAEPLSPHRAAELDGVAIDPARLVLPEVAGALVVEGAGGVLVPLTREVLYGDVFARWRAPVVIVARTGLGTINHTLLSLEALRARGVPVLGVAFSGEANDDNEATICAMGRVKRLGRLPRLVEVSPQTLAEAFAANFRLKDFA
ncbi:MAG TPA: dethiobiotin synthase [Novosphingobium sp.]|nr:dethiobiotin synthase [Novosphingobium sp.]